MNFQLSKCNDIIAVSSVNHKKTTTQWRHSVLHRVSGQRQRNIPTSTTTFVLYSRRTTEQYIINIRMVFIHQQTKPVKSWYEKCYPGIIEINENKTLIQPPPSNQTATENPQNNRKFCKEFYIHLIESLVIKKDNENILFVSLQNSRTKLNTFIYNANSIFMWPRFHVLFVTWIQCNFHHSITFQWGDAL